MNRDFPVPKKGADGVVRYNHRIIGCLSNRPSARFTSGPRHVFCRVRKLLTPLYVHRWSHEGSVARPLR